MYLSTETRDRALAAFAEVSAGPDHASETAWAQAAAMLADALARTAWTGRTAPLRLGRRAPLRRKRGTPKLRYPVPVARATFADGTVTRSTFGALEGRPLDWAAAARNCQHSYAFGVRHARCNAAAPRDGSDGARIDWAHEWERQRAVPVNVPAIAELTEETTGEAYPVAIAAE